MGVYFQLKLHALTHAEWPISFHFLFHGPIETDSPRVVRVKDPRTELFLGIKISETKNLDKKFSFWFDFCQKSFVRVGLIFVK